ncbi:MAG: formylglycine-generating enzyme family protein, partial [Leptospiraceae bacterium]|nr:formylglycine-generating enzyme family protein [Leptospiraceae bacterium]
SCESTKKEPQNTKGIPSRLIEGDCENPPEGMVCIPGGNAIIGSTREEADRAIEQAKKDLEDRLGRLKEQKLSRSQIADLKEEIELIKKQPSFIESEVPRQTVYVKTFYIDKYEASNAEYRECIKAGECKVYKNIKSGLYSRSLDDKQPAVPITWEIANQYCRFRGKRLPTEAEWEKVARGGEKGTIYPWGNEEPDCKRSNYKYCTDDVTLPVGSFPPGHYEVYDMAGNGYEWVNDWASECRTGGNCKEPCKDCVGNNPQGPCGGVTPCETQKLKILKGGSWWWSSVHNRGASRRPEVIQTGGHRLSVRCASDTPVLTNSPAWMIKNPPPEPAKLTKPTAEQLKTLHELEAYDTLNKPLCKTLYQSPAHCKDPVSYVKTNEPRNWHFVPYVRNLGGGYAGVAADSNYSYMALARTEWAWLFDFDINIVNLHRMLKAFIIKAETPEQLVDFFQTSHSSKALKLLKEVYANHPDLPIMEKVYKKYRGDLYEHYKLSLRKNPKEPEFGWLSNPEAYKHIRELYSLDRISISPGDMLKDKTIRSIAKSAKKLGVNIRIYYPSNAEEFWKYSEEHKKNILSLPFDESSIIISTVEPKLHKKHDWHPRHKSGFAGFWHYLIRGGLNHQRNLLNPYILGINDILSQRTQPTEFKDFSTIRVPGSLPVSKPSE